MMKYDKYKSSGIDWIGSVPTHWSIKRVKDIVVRIGSGVTPKGGSEVYVNSGVPLLRSQNVYDDGLRIDDVSFIDEATHNKMKSSQLKPNDILINITGASIGRTCIVPQSMPIANINQHIIYIRLNKRLVPFISNYFKTYAVKEYINLIQAGTSKEALNMGQTLNVPVILPPLTEQTAIAHYLDTKTQAIDKKVNLLTQKAETYKELRKSIINEAVTKGLNSDYTDEMIITDRKSSPSSKSKTISGSNNAKLKESGIEWIGKIPEHWEVKRLKEVGQGIIGLTYSPTDIVDEKDGGILVLRSSNIQNDKIDFSNNVFVKVRPNKNLIVRKGDILICSRNGSRALIGKNICIDDSSAGYTFGAFMTIFRTKYFGYVSYYFKSQLFDYQSGAFMTSTINQLTINTLNNLIIPVPSSLEQTAIAHYLDEKTQKIDAIVGNLGKQIATLKELRKTLINDVVTGKIKVSEPLIKND